ncbi:MAG: hypothetical protein ABI688_04080 [Bacteroidota bacterium]
MRKILFLSTAILLVCVSFASTSILIKPRLKANEILIPIGNGKSLSVLELSTMKIKQVEALRGEKMKFADRLIFKAAQNKLRQNINSDGTINNEKLVTKLKKAGGESGFHFGGFALGFLLGLLGVIIAYIIKDDYKRNRVKWAWIGFAIYAAIVIAILLAGGA